MATIGGVRSVYQSWQVKTKPRHEQKNSSRNKQRDAEDKKQKQPSKTTSVEDDKLHIDEYA